MVRIGITGGIGSGKSYVSRLLQERGVPVYDTDSEAKRLMQADVDIRQGLTGLLGETAYQADGTLNKPLVAGYLFAGPRHAARINAIVHPRVKADFLRWVATKADCAFVALERDGTTEEKIRRRMAAQMDDEMKCRLSDYVIRNDGIEPLAPQLDDLLKTLEKS